MQVTAALAVSTTPCPLSAGRCRQAFRRDPSRGKAHLSICREPSGHVRGFAAGRRLSSAALPRHADELKELGYSKRLVWR